MSRSPVASLAAALVVALVFVPTVAAAQEVQVPQASPSARVQQRVGLTDFAVDYSSPGVKGRPVFGGLVPLDKPWRTGANAATKFTASRDFKFGDKQVPAGAYGLYTIPGKTSWTVVLNSNSEAWGATPPDTAKDVARVTVKPSAIPLRERFTVLFSDTTDDATKLELEWEKVRVSVPVSVDTRAHVMASIDKGTEEAWHPHFVSARYLLESKGDLNKALGYIDTSIAVKPTWWNQWVKAQILAQQGKAKDAVAAGTKAQELGKGDRVFEGFFKGEIDKSIAEWKKK